MKNKIITALTVLVVCFALVIPAFAEAGYNVSDVTGFVPVERTLEIVVDNADVLSDVEEAELILRLEEIGAMYSVEVGLVTVDSLRGKSLEEYADDFYDYNGFGYGENDDGLLLLYNTGSLDDERGVYITTHGTATDLFTDTEIDYIIEMIIPFLINGQFMDAFSIYTDECLSALDSSLPAYFILISIAMGFGITFIIVKIQASKLKTVRQKVDAADYITGFNLTGDNDTFIYKNVRSIPIQTNKGSSTHRSSSGRSHGGGGRSF